MELSTKAIVAIIVVALVAAVLSSFFIFQSGAQISKAEASRIFEERCVEYGRRGCSWDVTEEQGFASFLQSCKALHGGEREAFSCLYSLCGQCKEFEPRDLECAAQCSALEGLKIKGSIADQCGAYGSGPCAGFACGACG